jgi:predicted dehydrogenase
MVELMKKYGVQLTVVHNWLFSHMMQKILNCLEKEELGDILGVEIELLHSKDDLMAANASHWCHFIEAGRFGELLPHPIYIIRAILGDVDIKYVLGSKLGTYHWMPIDELRIIFANKQGKSASVYVSFNTPRAETTLKVIGTKGILVSNLSTNIVIKKRYRDIRIREVLIDDIRLLKDYLNSRFSVTFAVLSRQYKGTHNEFMKAFKNSLIHNSKLPVTVEDALEVVKLHKALCAIIHEQYFSK